MSALAARFAQAALARYGQANAGVVGEAIVQRAQAIATTDHAELVRVSAELAAARAELERLRRAAALPPHGR
jgi:hypothetical protein